MTRKVEASRARSRGHTKRIAVVGAGTGGTLVANLLAKQLKNRIRNGQIAVDLFGDQAEHYFQPSYLDVAFRGKQPSKISRDESTLLRKEVNYRQDQVRHIDLNERTIHSKVDEAIRYDYLVVATGTRADAQAIPGLMEASLDFHTDASRSADVWRTLQNFNGGKIVIVITSVPYKCPAAPNEASFILDDYLRRRGIRGKSQIIFATPYPRAYPAERLSKVIEPLYEKRGIEVVTFFNTESVDPVQKKLYSLEGDTLDYDLLIAVPPHRGAEVIRASGMGDKEGWIPTDKFTLRIAGYDDAYALGDATNLPISKTGVVAHLESNVVAQNIVSDLNGLNQQHMFNGRINCPFETGGGKATFVIATYESPPKPIQPTRLRLLMKKGFSRMYWTALSGSWEPLFNLYFGRTSTKAAKISNLMAAKELQAAVSTG